MDDTECYIIGYDEDEVISTLFFHDGKTYNTYAEAATHLDTYDVGREFFRVYLVRIEPVEEEH